MYAPGLDYRDREKVIDARRTATNKVTTSGMALLFAEWLLFLYWFVTAFFVMVHDAYVEKTNPTGKRFIVDHTLGSLHFVVMIALHQIMEYYDGLKHLRRLQKRGAPTERDAEVPKMRYLLEWTAVVMVSLVSDILVIGGLVITGALGSTASIDVIETAFGVWALSLTLLTLVWVAWVCVLSRRIESKFANAKKW